MDPSRRKAIHEAMVRLAEGDRRAFDAVVRDLWPVVLAFVRRSTRRPSEAEDIAQEVFVRICGRISELDRSRDGVAWALGIARYEILTDATRARRRRESLDDASLGERGDGRPNQEEALVDADLHASLGEILGQLSAADREVLGLDEAASSSTAPSSTPGATIRKRRQRALERLRELWRSLHG